MENELKTIGEIHPKPKGLRFLSSMDKFFWIPVIELAVLAFTTLGTTITLFLHSDAKMDEFRKEYIALRKEIFEENKEFHSRLYSIEERTRSNNGR